MEGVGWWVGRVDDDCECEGVMTDEWWCREYKNRSTII